MREVSKKCVLFSWENGFSCVTLNCLLFIVIHIPNDCGFWFFNLNVQIDCGFDSHLMCVCIVLQVL